MALDHRFPDLGREAAVLAAAGAALDDLKGLPEEEAFARASGADAILLGARFQFTAERLARLERCQAIVRYGVGVDNVDVAAAKARGIVVSCVPDYCVEEVATHAVALLLALHRQLASYDARTRRGEAGADTVHPIRRLTGLNLGVIGFGRIGRETARRAAALGLGILAHDPLLPDAAITAEGAIALSLDDLLGRADAITLHVPLSPQTRNLIDAARLSRLKRGALVINVGRGGLIDERALAAALLSGHLGGAGLDVTTEEPLPPGHQLFEAPNTILTPHVAWYSTGAQQDLQTKAAEEVARVLRGESAQNAL